MTVFAVLMTMLAVLSIIINISLFTMLVNVGRTLNQVDSEVLNQLTELLEEPEDDENSVKVAIYEGMAYWVAGQSVYFAPVDENGDVVSDQAQELDVMSMSDEETKLLFEILDALKEDE